MDKTSHFTGNIASVLPRTCAHYSSIPPFATLDTTSHQPSHWRLTMLCSEGEGIARPCQLQSHMMA